MAATAGAVGTLCAGPQAALCGAAVASVYCTLLSASDAAIDYLYDHDRRLTTRLVPYVHSYWERR
jgi:hypothetical protein